MARQLTRVPWWNHPHRGRNCRERGRRVRSCPFADWPARDAPHRTRTFREEYLELLRRSGVEFDERYL